MRWGLSKKSGEPHWIRGGWCSRAPRKASRYHCPTWFDYLRQRNRSTPSEGALEQRAMAFHVGSAPIRVRRMLERPFGSVRSKDDTLADVPHVIASATGGST
jgi:hypothetical protein